VFAVELPIYQVDAFASRLFAGNPAAVCPLEEWLPAPTMQAIAAENNLAETAFYLPSSGDYELRWFTPATEVALCGHATLATAFVISTLTEPGRNMMRFHTRSGPLEVTRQSDIFSLDLPARPAAPTEAPGDMSTILGAMPVSVLRSADDYVAVFAGEATIKGLMPDLVKLAKLPAQGVIVTAPGRDVDFVSRYFAPAAGIAEDPVTGAAHCTLVPYWSQRLGKTTLQARQISARGGELSCRALGNRVMLSGRAVLYLEGRIHI
jgi:PhzF family phenazine biosynthesis protein